MKYRLLKWYPSLPQTWEKGMEIGQGDRIGDYADFSPCSSGPSNKLLNYSEVYNNPDYWQKVVLPNYEIVTYCNINNNNVTFNRKSDICNEIHSVKRLSDDKVFTIGDTVFNKNNTLVKWEINDFLSSLTEEGIILVRSKHSQNIEELDNIRKVDPVTFVTEDGKTLTEKDEFWVVTTDKKNLVGNRAHTFPSFSRDKSKYLRFSSLDTANNYRIHNKNCLSLLDVTSNVNLGLGSGGKLAELIKLKLGIK